MGLVVGYFNVYYNGENVLIVVYFCKRVKNFLNCILKFCVFCGV